MFFIFEKAILCFKFPGYFGKHLTTRRCLKGLGFTNKGFSKRISGVWSEVKKKVLQRKKKLNLVACLSFLPALAVLKNTVKNAFFLSPQRQSHSFFYCIAKYSIWVFGLNLHIDMQIASLS